MPWRTLGSSVLPRRFWNLGCPAQSPPGRMWAEEEAIVPRPLWNWPKTRVFSRLNTSERARLFNHRRHQIRAAADQSGGVRTSLLRARDLPAPAPALSLVGGERNHFCFPTSLTSIMSLLSASNSLNPFSC